MATHVLMDVRRVRAHTGIERGISAWHRIARDDARPTSFFTPDDHPDRSPSPGEGRAIRAAMRRHGADLFHATYPYLVLPRGVPSLLTLHDTLQLDRAQPMRTVARALIGLDLRRSRGIVTVSEHSRREIVERLDVDPARVWVVPNGVEVPTAATADPDRDRPYLLYVGNVRPHKHVPALLDHVAATFPERGIRLVAVLSGTPDELAALPAHGSVERRVGVDDATLGRLRDGALATVSLASGEGFGLPPLEAAARGVPALLHDSGAHREVLGEGAAVYCGLDRDSFAAALDRLLARRDELARAARARGEQFSWQASWDRLTAVYDQVA